MQSKIKRDKTKKFKKQTTVIKLHCILVIKLLRTCILYAQNK